MHCRFSLGQGCSVQTSASPAALEAIIELYDLLIKAYDCVTLQVTDAVAQLHRLRGDLMKAACLLTFILLIKFV